MTAADSLLIVGSTQEWPTLGELLTARGPWPPSVKLVDPLTVDALQSGVDGTIVLLGPAHRIEAVHLIERARRDLGMAMLAAGNASLWQLDTLLLAHDFDAFIDVQWPTPVVMAAIRMALREVRLGRGMVDIQRQVLEQVRTETSTLYDQAVRDELTQLYNRRHFNELIAREHERSVRYGHPYALLFLDLDDLKRLNTDHGHAGGSQALCEFATLLAASLRTSDVAARLGGDEFVVFLGDCDRSAAIDFADRFCWRLREHALIVDGHKLHLTVSCGVACFPEHGNTYTDLIKRADEALYAAKAGGKNRAVIAAGKQGAQPRVIG